MPTTTRARRSQAATSRRFSRTGTAPRTTTRRFSGPAMNARRHASPQRRGLAGGWLQRRRPEKQSALKRMMSSVGGAMPGRKGAGAMAVLAGAAGLAIRKRDKVASMVRREDGRSTSTAGAHGGMGAGDTPGAHGGMGAGDTPKA